MASSIPLPGPDGWSYALKTKNLNWSDGMGGGYTETFGSPTYNATLGLFSYHVPGFANAVAKGGALNRRAQVIPLAKYAPVYAAAGQPVFSSPFAAPDAAASIFGEVDLKT